MPHSKRGVWTASFLVVTLSLLCIGLVSGAPALARGGFWHGGGGFGMHGFHGDGRAHALAPVFVLIAMTKVTDADAFKATMNDLVTATAPFGGRVAADMEKPESWEGSASERTVMLQFASLDQAQAWKNSDAFKAFDAGLRRSSELSMQLIQGLPLPEAHDGGGGRHGRGLDPRAYEANVRDYDAVLTKMHGICKGC